MWLISLRDLQWRRRRFLIAVLATGLAFSLTLVMAGVLHAMRNESARTVELYDADAWVVAEGVSGPFTGTQFLPGSLVATVRSTPGVTSAHPLLVARASFDGRDVNVIGYEPGAWPAPHRIEQGHLPTSTGTVIADATLDVGVGEEVVLGGRSFSVAATTSGTSFYFGTPTVFLAIDDVREVFFAGQPVTSAVVVQGRLDAAPTGADLLSGREVQADLDRVLSSTDETLAIVNNLLRVMACGTIAAMVYVSVLERLRDFAVLKAIGSTAGSLVAGLVAQSCVLALTAAAVAVGLAAVIAPTFAFAVEIPTSAYAELLVIALGVGSLASVAGLRRVLRIDPALSFGGV